MKEVTTQEPVDRLLQVNDLAVSFFTRRGTVQAVRGVTFHIDRGESLGLVGESGAGKTVTSQAILGLIDLPGRVTNGEIMWRGRRISGVEGKSYAREILGKSISAVFQDPMSSLNPLLLIGSQLREVMQRHLKMSKSQSNTRALELLDMVRISAPRKRMQQYPYELSGGMRQRVMIAMAIATEPELLIADEATTALDVTIQAQILELLREIQRTLRLSLLLITHDLGVVAGLCHRVSVMYGGKIVETASAAELFSSPAHPYTKALLEATPRIDTVTERLPTIEGVPVELLNPPRGCPFEPRCAFRVAKCEQEMPAQERRWASLRQVACWCPLIADTPATRQTAR